MLQVCVQWGVKKKLLGALALSPTPHKQRRLYPGFNRRGVLDFNVVVVTCTQHNRRWLLPFNLSVVYIVCVYACVRVNDDCVMGVRVFAYACVFVCACVFACACA